MIRLRVPAQQAKPGPPLAPILGQHQIKVADFVSRFNTASSGWTPGTPLGVQIHKIGSNWTLKIKPPTLPILLSAYRGKVPRSDLWVLAQSLPPRRVRTLFGSLQSLGWEVA